MHDFAAELRFLDAKGRRRHRRIVGPMQGARARIDGREVIAFSSNDYLGLATDSRVAAALAEGAMRFGAGAGASHLVSGHQQVHEELEQRLARFVGMPRALLFSSGYLANLAVITTLAGPSCGLYADRLNHASLNDAMLLSRSRFRRYAHCDVDRLEALLQRPGPRRKVVVTDAVFSMDGDIAPLGRILGLCERHDAWLVVDDAHGFGVLGAEGAGSLAHFGIRSPRIIYVGTLGKAAGVAGAFVAAQPDFIDLLINKGRSYVYTTATPPGLANALLKSLDLIATEGWRRERIAQLSRALAGTVHLRRWRLLPSETAIHPLIVGASDEAVALSEWLGGQGLFVPAIRPPTVPEGSARLRISLSAAHTRDDIQRLAEALLDAEGRLP